MHSIKHQKIHPEKSLRSQTELPLSVKKFATQATQTDNRGIVIRSDFLETTKLLAEKTSNMKIPNAENKVQHNTKYVQSSKTKRVLLSDPPLTKHNKSSSDQGQKPIVLHQKNENIVENPENRETMKAENQEAWVTQTTKKTRIISHRPDLPDWSQNMNTSSQNEYERGSDQSVRDTYRRKKCMLIHDGTFAGFDQNKFSRQLEVHEYISPSISSMTTDTKLKEMLIKNQPECLFIHVGSRDIKLRRNLANVKHDFESMLYYLLEKTRSNICFSTVIPTANNDAYNKRVSELNETMEKMVSHAREINVNNRSCLFSYNNNSVREHNKLQMDESKLSVVGKLIMWRRLDDGLRKTLRINRKQISQHRNIRNQRTDRYE